MAVLARVSKIYETPEGFKFTVSGFNPGEAINKDRKGAVKSRAMMIKFIKSKGVKVLCQ